MNNWRMSFRIGKKGHEMWPECCARGIAAMGYYFDGKPVVGDCSKLTEDEYAEIWRTKGVVATSPQGSLKNLAYKMRKGDIIYVKEGVNIVGKGVITEEYNYDPNILNGAESRWEHFVRVDWEKDYPSFELNLEANQHIVLKLNKERMGKIREMESKTRKEIKGIEVEEGKRYESEVIFRSRNRALVEAKKINSDYRCEVCGMMFKEVYGKIGNEYIIAHHKNTIGNIEKTATTTLDDIALVCANCHAMLHTKNPPLSLDELHNKMK